MADDLCSWAKDIWIVKHAKKNPLVLTMLVLIFVMVCGVYICSVCLKQVGGRATGRLLSVQVVERPCDATHIEPSDKPYLHFRKPNTFSSYNDISSNGEIFSVKVRRSNTSTITETFDKIFNLEWLTSASKNECAAAVGLKWMLNQGLMQHYEETKEYVKSEGVSANFLFRRNLLRCMISILANSYDQNAKLLNGTHISHVHSTHEAEILASYRPTVNTTSLIPSLRQVFLVKKSMEYFKSTRHIILYSEDIINNQTKLVDVQNFLRVPVQELSSVK